MGGVYRRKRTHTADKAISKRARLRRRTKDLDQVALDIETGYTGPAEYDEDLPGGGRHLCVPCARHFADARVLEEHVGTRSHRRRLKLLKETPYTLEEAAAAGGCGANDFYTRRAALIRPAGGAPAASPPAPL